MGNDHIIVHSVMDAATTTALSKALGKLAKGSRPDLSAGEHEVDSIVTLHVTGKMKVGADETYTPTANIPIKIALALFLRYAGVTGPAAMEALVKAMNEAREIGELPDKEKKTKLAAIREIADLNAAEARVNEMVGKLDDAVRVGKVTGKVAVEEVSSLRPPAKAEPVETDEAAEVA